MESPIGIRLFASAFLVFTFLTMIDGQMIYYEKTVSEIESTIGFVPKFFNDIPKSNLPGAWESFKALNESDTEEGIKSKTLVSKALSTQIPATYDIFLQTAVNKANGASDEEVHKIVDFTANCTHWKNILTGIKGSYETVHQKVLNVLHLKANQESQIALAR